MGNINPTSPLTGAAQVGLTSPTYTLMEDVAPSPNGVQWAVSALGGTQTGVEAHSVSKPFTLSFFKPMTFRPLGSKNSQGVLSSIPKNTYKVITRKGVEVHSDGDISNMMITTTIDVPAGADVVDPESLRAALSMHIGALSDESSDIGTLTVSGVL
jgi:hypothetical protein